MYKSKRERGKETLKITTIKNMNNIIKKTTLKRSKVEKKTSKNAEKLQIDQSKTTANFLLLKFSFL